MYTVSSRIYLNSFDGHQKWPATATEHPSYSKMGVMTFDLDFVGSTKSRPVASSSTTRVHSREPSPH